MAAETFEVRRAERRQARLRLALGAASNGGKTWSAIELAFGIVQELIDRGLLSGTLEGKVGLVDTERKSADLYSHLGPYDVVQLGPPYSVPRYVGALQALERAGCVVAILDSISHAWVGHGGVLQLLDSIEDSKRFSAFGKTVNPQQDEFVDAMLRSPCHIIATMRSKTAWVLEARQNRSGATVMAPKRIGMAPVQRPGIEYEFTTMLDLDTDTHAARVVKNRCSVFDGWQPQKLTRDHGRKLAAWLLEGSPSPVPPSGTPAERAQAYLEASLRAVERAENMPDLARVLGDGDRGLRAFLAEGVHTEAIGSMREQLAAAKDTRKAALGRSDGPGPGPMIDLELVVGLEQMLVEAEVTLEECREKFGVQRLALLPAASLQAVASWIHDQALGAGITLTLPAKLAAAGVTLKKPGKFDDMKDDIPW